MIRLLFTSGRGPAECRIAVGKAVAALAAEAASLGLETDCLEGPNTDGHGPASAIVVIHGGVAAAFARPWVGAIQWVAQSPLRPHHKRKNWFIGVFELPALPDAPKTLAVQDVRFEAFRAGGPGGQHRTRPRALCAPPTSLAASLSWRGTSARSTETRHWHWSGSRRC
jgi:peptide chain release factor